MNAALAAAAWLCPGVQLLLISSPCIHQLHRSHAAADSLVSVPLREVLGACWTIMRSVCTFQLVVLLGPLITSQTMPMARDFSKVR